jgi:hypothetical protein
LPPTRLAQSVMVLRSVDRRSFGGTEDGRSDTILAAINSNETGIEGTVAGPREAPRRRKKPRRRIGQSPSRPFAIAEVARFDFRSDARLATALSRIVGRSHREEMYVDRSESRREGDVPRVGRDVTGQENVMTLSIMCRLSGNRAKERFSGLQLRRSEVCENLEKGRSREPSPHV